MVPVQDCRRGAQPSCRRGEVLGEKAYKSVEFWDELGCTWTVSVPRRLKDSQLCGKLEGWEWVVGRWEENG